MLRTAQKKKKWVKIPVFAGQHVLGTSKFICSAFITVFSIANEDKEHSDDLVKKLLNFTSLPIVYFSVYFKNHSAVFT